jgi:ATP-dependent DNA helicase PIF1
LPTPSVDFNNLNSIPRIIAEERSYNKAELKARWERGYLQANPEQIEILDLITSAVQSDDGDSRLFFIDGPGGTGKLFIENLILAKVRSSGTIALSVASSGIAAILLDGSRTSHSQLKIPIEIHSESLCPISAQTDLAALLKATSLIIWDEAPSQHHQCFEVVDRTLKDLRNNPRWFGGITVMFTGTMPFTFIFNLVDTASALGDFRQCLPVVSKGTRAQIVTSTRAYALFWKDIKVMPLEVNMCVLAQAMNMSPEERIHATKFAEWQLEVAKGTTNNKDGISIKLPPSTNIRFFGFTYIRTLFTRCQ